MARFYDIMDVAEELCILSGDSLMRNKGLYLTVAKSVFDDMNEDSLKLADKVKIPFRQIFCVDKKTNSIHIPKPYLRICSINAIDKYGCYYPVYRNEKLEDDIVDVSEAHDCACENKCSSYLCNTIKGYEAVTTVKDDYMPNGDPVSFTCIDKKMVDNQGFFYEQTQYPLRVYESGVWTDTIKYTENKTLCKVEVEANGCVCDTEENLEKICDACGITDTSIVYGGNSITPPVCAPDATSWVYQCASRMEWFNVQCGSYPYRCGNGYDNIYNISQLGDRIIFPHTFGYDKVMIRFYEDISLKNLQIPYLAKDCFMTGLQYFSYCRNDKKQNLADKYGAKFARQKWGLLLELNKLRIAELRVIFTPQVFMPSYIENRRHGYYDNNNNYYE